MELLRHYDTLFTDSINEIKTNNCQIDELIDSPHDTRFGITLVIRLSSEINSAINSFLDELRVLEPHQYYYPSIDRHVTLLSIISCYEGFTPDKINITEYVSTMEKALNDKHAFDIEFKGITMSPSCVMVQGFPVDNTLNGIRENLRSVFKNTPLPQSLDQRYLLQTAHCTVLRFKKPLSQKDQFIDILNKYRDYNFGRLTVHLIEFVFNDWYQREKNSKLLYRYFLHDSF